MKFAGLVGFQFDEEEVKPGVWRPVIKEIPYTGDVLRNNRRWQTVSDQQNDNLNLNNQISILGDLYMQENWPSIRYIVWNGVKWSVSVVDVSYPRLTFDIGGVYNGETEAGTS